MSAPSLPPEGTFPKLTQEQLARIAAFAKERRFADGELLWKQGDCDRPLFAVLEGKVTVNPRSRRSASASVFAVGDVRASSVKRVAAAVGEGSVCVQLVHRVLAE